MVRENKEQIILEVKARPPLWDEKHVNFRKKRIVNILWDQVAAACSLANVEVRSKWTYLKSQYKREMQKILHQESSFVRPTWPYFDLMAFTQNDAVANQIHASLAACEIQNSYEEDIVASTSNDNEYAETLTNGYVTDEHFIELTSVPYGMVSTVAVQTSRRSSIASTSSGSDSRKRRQKSNDSISKLIQLEKQKVNFLQNLISNDNSDSSDMNFFKSLVPYMEYLRQSDNLKLRSEILDLVTEQNKLIRKKTSTLTNTIQQRSSSRIKNLNKNFSG